MLRATCLLIVVCAPLVGVRTGLAQAPAPRPLPPRPGTAAADQLPAPDARRGGTSLVSTLVALTVVIGLILAAGKFWRKLAPAAARSLPAAAVDVLGRKNLDSRHSVTLLRCGSRILVLAFSPQGVQVLSEMTDPVEVDFLAGLCRQAGEDNQFTHAFLDLFRRDSRSSGEERVGSPSVAETA